ncbi:hypothetical protein BDB01DRAFT_789931, partial [Pilobolus umbonatus]
MNSINTLPDDILLILLCTLDYSSLNNLSHTCRRYRFWVGYTLKHYRLPYETLLTRMDQEGHGVFSCYYAYHSINLSTFTITFKSTNTLCKQYRKESHLDSPRLRCLYRINHNDKSHTLLHKSDKSLSTHSHTTLNTHIIHFQSSCLVRHTTWSLYYDTHTPSHQIIHYCPHTIHIPFHQLIVSHHRRRSFLHKVKFHISQFIHTRKEKAI